MCFPYVGPSLPCSETFPLRELGHGDAPIADAFLFLGISIVNGGMRYVHFPAGLPNGSCPEVFCCVGDDSVGPLCCTEGNSAFLSGMHGTELGRTFTRRAG